MKHKKPNVTQSQWKPAQRRAVDGRMWWVVVSSTSGKACTLYDLAYGKWATKRECSDAIKKARVE